MEYLIEGFDSKESFDAGKWVGKFSTGFYAVPDKCTNQIFFAEEIADLA